MAKVLLVEDEDITRTLLETRLSWAGHRVRSVSSAAEAVAVLDRVFTPEVVVTDMFMPGGSGLGLVDDLRRHPEHGDLPVVFLSGRALPGDVSAGRALGATYLAKPCSTAELTDAIDAAVGSGPDPLEGAVRRRIADLGGVDSDEERELVAGLLRRFVEWAPTALAGLRDAADDSTDPAALAAAAHRLKGAAANLGAASLATACGQLEDGDPAGSVAAVAAELAETCRVFYALAGELEGGPGTVTG